MSQNHIQQLTLHLSQALDQNYNVVNMDAVLYVICTLEGTTITKDQLEATRLAKYINQLRRRTKNEKLARRAKSLLKKWREMVGIHHTVNDSNNVQPVRPIAVINATDSNISITDDNHINAVHQYCSSPPTTTTTYRAISDLHSNIDLSNPDTSKCTNESQQQTSFSNLIKHIDDIEESRKAIKNQRDADQQQKTSTFINELSSNSTSYLGVPASGDKLNVSSIVIDIVSDSDENDCGTQSQPSVQPKFITSSSSLTIPTQICPKAKKLKKDKKRKEKSQHSELLHETHSQKSKNALKKTIDLNYFPFKEGKVAKMHANDSDILTLSNSSMSSILSGDATSISANSQNKVRTSFDLTFAGRFKSVNRVVAFDHDNSSDPKTNCRINEVEQPILKTIFEDYINNDSSTSCSRLSSFEENRQQIHSKSFVEPNKPDQLKSNDSRHDNFLSELPKKRGRKKGSKGVDSVIAKESSLSQQIFFGSGVKKVKTTKELFNEIQSRKLSISYNRSVACANKPSTAPPHRNRESSLTARPTSSCSETSLHSPHILEANLGNISISGIESKFSNILEDIGNTDSDTITSEPSHDSIKSGEIKRSTSLESINSSIQATLSFKNVIESTITTKINHNNDVTTELMHLVNGLNSPRSVDDTEKLYQTQIVPCTCVIQEEMKIVSENQSKKNLEIEAAKSDAIEDNSKGCAENAIEIMGLKPCDNHKAEEVPSLIPPKPIKSIFDLDFDDENDPLHSIMNNVLKVDPTNFQSGIHNNDHDNVPHRKLLNASSLAQIGGNYNGNNYAADDNENGNNVLETLSIYTVVEDPNCIAKQRFMLQTNQVTNYHINALHNLYVPNINGNWNCIEEELSPPFLKSKISTTFHKKFDSYSVSDGADVVPKYGSLTHNQRIPKDLSSLKFNKNYTKKFAKFRIIPPFLGIAKCLPTCRRAAKRAKHDGNKSTLNLSAEENLQIREDNSMPLKVDVDANFDITKNQCSIRAIDIKSNNNNNNNSSTLLSCDLLKIASELETTCQSDGTITLCSHPTTSEQIDQDLVERNRKKRRKSYKFMSKVDTIECEHGDITKPLLKRIKIAMNGNINDHRQVSLLSRRSNNNSSEYDACDYLSTSSQYHQYQKSSTVSDNDVYEHKYCSSRSLSSLDSIAGDEDDDHFKNDNGDENNKSNGEYAIVQKPMMGGGNNHNHIVLTIKKTPNKNNSPANSTSPISPFIVNSCVGVVAADAETDTVQNGHLMKPYSRPKDETSQHNIRKIQSMPHTCIHKCNRSRYQCQRFRHRRTRKHQISRKEETIDLQLKHIFNNGIARRIQSKTKTHRKLFFTKELYREDNVGRTERIINYSSSSSNYDESDSEQDKKKKTNISSKNNFKLKVETDTASAASVRNLMTSKFGQQDEEKLFSSSDESVKEELLFGNQREDDCQNFDIIQRNKSPTENNGMLLSFNSIYATDIKDVTQLQSFQIEDCDDVNSICYNSNNIRLMKSHSLKSYPFKNDALKEVSNNDSPSLLTNHHHPHIEHRTGIRTIVEDDSTIFQVQQFKEWHEVLQLQSYNNEPLIVLPYVVLE